MHILTSNSQDFSIFCQIPSTHPVTNYNLSPRSWGGQLQRGDGADAIQMARCSGTTGDHAASLGAAQWGNGQCGDERDGEEWVTWRELVMSWMRGLSWEGGMSFVLSCLRVWSYPEWCRLLLPRYPLLHIFWRLEGTIFATPYKEHFWSDASMTWFGLPKLRRWQTVLLLLQDSNCQKLDVDVILGNVFVVMWAPWFKG